MDVLYTCDNNYIWLMGISMLSLFENNKKTDAITVYLLGENISDENRELLFLIAKQYGRKCIVIDLPQIQVSQELLTDRWPRSAFSRLYCAQILPPDIEKIIYLDCDTLILRPLDELACRDVNGYTVYGVKDCIGGLYKKNIGLGKDSIYINAGVLIFNLKKMREVDISKQIGGFLKRYGRNICYADQDILNGIFDGEIGILSAEYDVMTLECMYSYDEICSLRRPTSYYCREEIEYAVKYPRIVHFTTCMLDIRPWFNDSQHPLVSDFLKYKNMSPWKNRKLETVGKRIGVRNRVLKLVHIFPRNIETNILGLVHAVLYPIITGLKSEINKQKQERV